MGSPLITVHFSQHLYHRQSALAKSAAALLFRTPSPSFKEASWVRVSPDSSLFAFGRLTNSENVVLDSEKAAAKTAMNASHV
jgi:hypothetical protein